MSEHTSDSQAYRAGFEDGQTWASEAEIDEDTPHWQLRQFLAPASGRGTADDLISAVGAEAAAEVLNVSQLEDDSGLTSEAHAAMAAYEEGWADGAEVIYAQLRDRVRELLSL